MLDPLRKLVVIAALILAVAMIGRLGWKASGRTPGIRPVAVVKGERFQCPKHPGHIAPQRGVCPICRSALVPTGRKKNTPASSGASSPQRSGT